MALTKDGKRIDALQKRAGYEDNATGFAALLGIHANTLVKWKRGIVKRIKPIYWEKMEALAGASRR